MVIDDPEILNEFLESTFQEIKLRFRILLLNLMYIPSNYNEDTDSVNSTESDQEESDFEQLGEELLDNFGILSFHLEPSFGYSTPPTPTNSPVSDSPVLKMDLDIDTDMEEVGGCFSERCPKCDTFHDMDMLFNDVDTLYSNRHNLDPSGRGHLRGNIDLFGQVPDERAAGEANASSLSAKKDTDKAASKKNNPGNIDNTIYVENVNVTAKTEEMKKFFSKCGTVKRVLFFLIPPGGYAQVEFDRQSSVKAALKMSFTEFKGLVIKVFSKAAVLRCKHLSAAKPKASK